MRGRLVAAPVLVAAVVLQVAVARQDHLATLGCFVVGLGAWSWLVALQGRRGLSVRFVAVLVLALAVAVVAFPPATSKDVNSYALYGRMVSVYHVSPYTHLPQDFSGDEWFPRLSYFWTDAPSVYGPVFTAVAAAGMWIGGDSFLAGRLVFQVVAAVSLVAAAALVARRTGWARAGLVVAANPLLLTFGVNDAHCDVLAGALVVAAVLGMSGARPVRAGILLAAAAMVKVSLAPALPGAFVWLWARHGARAAARFAVVAAAVIVVGFGLCGGADVLRPLGAATARITRFSIWNPVHQLLGSGDGAARGVSTLASVVVALVGGTWIVRRRHDPSPVPTLVAGLVAYQLLGAYVLAWYACWALPALAIVGGRWWRVVMVHASWLAIAYASGYAAIVVPFVLVGWWVLARRGTRAPGLPPKAPDAPILAGS